MNKPKHLKIHRPDEVEGATAPDAQVVPTERINMLTYDEHSALMDVADMTDEQIDKLENRKAA